MQTALIKARIVGFLEDAVLLLVVVFLGMLQSPQFTELLSAHFGTGVVGGFIALALSGLVSHLYNLKTIKKAKEKFGSDHDQEPIILI